MKPSTRSFFFLIAINIAAQAVNVQTAGAQSDKAQQLSSMIQQRETQLNKFYPTLKTRGDERKKIATITVLTEEVISSEAASEHIAAADSEVADFLVPLLSRQGLIDVTRVKDIRADQNVHRWLAGQGWNEEKLFATAKVLLLWVKIATKDVTVTEEEVKKYLANHPTVHHVPARTQVALSQCQLPTEYKTVSRGLPETEVFSPTLSLASRGPVVKAIAPSGWEELQLFLDIDQLEPTLRIQLEGKGVGDKFGPLQLRNGAVIAGKISAILPPGDFANSAQLWQYAAVLTKLDKVNQKQEFDLIVKKYFDGAPADVRGLGDLFAVAGGAIGALFGGVGAPVGAVLGGLVGNWVDGQIAAPGPMPMQAPMPAYYPGGGGGFNPYLQGGVPPMMPPQMWQGFQSSPYPQYLPPMPTQYMNQFTQWQGQLGFQASVQWSPPVFSPFPIRYN
jgi:hypothetical protein